MKGTKSTKKYQKQRESQHISGHSINIMTFVQKIKRMFLVCQDIEEYK